MKQEPTPLGWRLISVIRRGKVTQRTADLDEKKTYEESRVWAIAADTTSAGVAANIALLAPTDRAFRITDRKIGELNETLDSFRRYRRPVVGVSARARRRPQVDEARPATLSAARRVPTYFSDTPSRDSMAKLHNERETHAQSAGEFHQRLTVSWTNFPQRAQTQHTTE